MWGFATHRKANTPSEARAESLTFLTGLTGLTRLGNESLLCDKIILTQRGKEAERQRRMKKTLCLCVSVIKLTQRHKGSEAQSLTFLTGLTGLTRLGNESLLCDKKF